MAKKYIDRDAFLWYIKKNTPYIYHLIGTMILMFPTIDAEEVVRCKDCVCWEGNGSDLREKQADYLLANGVIVPPCKEGDIVYFIDDIFENLEHGKVCGIFVYKGKMSLVVDNGEENFIASWYLTREEAEKALAERNKL